MKIVSVMLKYDYGIEKRGESLEKKAFLPALKENVETVSTFWIEENGYPDDHLSLQRNILNFVESENPDVVFFILMKDEVSIETIRKISEKYVTINWFCDDQWRFETFTKFVAPALTYSITTDKYSLAKYKNIGYNNVLLSQWAAFEYIDNIDFHNISYKYDVSFIGARNSSREWIIKSLKKRGIKVECFGAGWQNGRVSYEQMKDIFLHSRINLNLSNSVSNDIRFIFSNIKSIKDYIKSKKRIEQIKARNFEIPCVGGFQISNYALGLEDYFDIGKEIVIFNSIDELEMQIKYYLNNEEERQKITMEAYKKSSKYTYAKKLEHIFDIVRLK